MEIYTDDLGFRHQEFFHDLKVRFFLQGIIKLLHVPLKLADIDQFFSYLRTQYNGFTNNKNNKMCIWSCIFEGLAMSQYSYMSAI